MVKAVDGRQWQPAQLERTQLPQLEPPAPPEEPPSELFDDPPIANVEKALRQSFAPQSGQAGFACFLERTKTSKRFSHDSQSYSKIGIRRPLRKWRGAGDGSRSPDRLYANGSGPSAPDAFGPCDPEQDATRAPHVKGPADAPATGAGTGAYSRPIALMLRQLMASDSNGSRS